MQVQHCKVALELAEAFELKRLLLKLHRNLNCRLGVGLLQVQAYKVALEGAYKPEMQHLIGAGAGASLQGCS